jgi:excisionase family DNA binding protein
MEAALGELARVVLICGLDREISSTLSVGRRTKRMEEIMTPSEVAALLKIHLKTVYKLAERGVIPGNRIGRSWRFSRNDVLELVSSKSMSLSDNGDGDSKASAVAGK